MFTILFVLANKYQDNLVKYTGFIFSGSSLAFCIWSIISRKMVNPQNYPQNLLVGTGNTAKYIFPNEVTDNFPFFSIFCASVQAGLTFFVAFIICINNKNNNISMFLSNITEKKLSNTQSQREDLMISFRQNLNYLKFFSFVIGNQKKLKSFNKSVKHYQSLSNQKGVNSLLLKNNT